MRGDTIEIEFEASNTAHRRFAVADLAFAASHDLTQCEILTFDEANSFSCLFSLE